MRIIVETAVDNSDVVANIATYMGEASLHVFAIGFLELAELARARASFNQCSIDAVIPAALYALRHSVELYLKHVIYDLHIVDDTTPVIGHKVMETFQKQKTAIALALECEQNAGFAWRDWLAKFDSLVAAVHDLDPAGHALRYPADINLIPHHGGGYSISIKHLGQCLDEIQNIYQEYDQRGC